MPPFEDEDEFLEIAPKPARPASSPDDDDVYKDPAEMFKNGLKKTLSALAYPFLLAVKALKIRRVRRWAGIALLTALTGYGAVYGAMRGHAFWKERKEYNALIAEGIRNHEQKRYSEALTNFEKIFAMPGRREDEQARTLSRKTSFQLNISQGKTHWLMFSIGWHSLVMCLIYVNRNIISLNWKHEPTHFSLKNYKDAIISIQNARKIPGYGNDTEAARLQREAEDADRKARALASAGENARKLQAAGRYDEAVRVWEDVIAQMPSLANDPEVAGQRTEIADTARRAREEAAETALRAREEAEKTALRAKAEAEEAARRAKEFATFMNDGKSRRAAKDYTVAAGLFQKALGVPGYANQSEATMLSRECLFAAALDAGDRNYTAKNYGESAAAFRRALEVPGYEEHEAVVRRLRMAEFAAAFTEGTRFYEGKNLIAAAASFRKALEVPGFEDNENAWNWLAQMYIAMPVPEGMPERVALDCGFGVPLPLTRIPAGAFMMGSPQGEGENSEKPQHQVIISQPFYMGVFPVTQEQFEAVMGVNPSHFKGKPDSLRRPVETVNWNDATEFCRRLSQKTNLTVRLPTEAEWEYACRAGITLPYHTGAAISQESANFYLSAGYTEELKKNKRETTPVDMYQANAWGLHDMTGNVWEWCSNWYGEYQQNPVIDPQGANESRYGRVVRGGAWEDRATECRSANRAYNDPGKRYKAVGFRVVVSLSMPAVAQPPPVSAVAGK